ncbi:MAG: ABC transporter substrate-binding protein [Verrucomicrobia bacterium]|nr:ABC transporter substrate-binding protein [Verrucomicrobiota bacterium]
MPAPTPDLPPADTRPRLLRVGFLALTDAAPFAAADHLGLFAQHGLRVELRREIGWATIREKIIYGELEAAQAPAPMLWSAQLGLGCPPCDVLTAHVLNLHGNALTLSRALREAGVRDGATLRIHARNRGSRSRLTFGVVFPFSSHHLLLRDWLRSAGLEPERDVRIVVVPPAQMFRNLVAGTLDGFCAGEPWNTLAVREGAGWCPMWSAAQAPGHAEKVLLVTRRFAEARAAEHAALVAALHAAGAWCDEPSNREPLAQILAEARWLNLPARVITPALLGRFDCGHDRVENVPDFHVFHRGGANVPAATKAAALQRALAAAGLLPPAAAADPELPRRLFREDLHRDALNLPPLHEPNSSPDLRGVAVTPG